ncbi:uncharacterized protein LOC122367937 isoform X2 [Amphibalanus amphitrite]|uniref:uncharacterized protein LOC122367937 isoform X2 n=1 Tax=Amphibalanus amphitrite TaxID=1232801 RepID=UPI001C9059A3|nr:uncharacterized protein LOC122367937 isoform X2 [Amphibalanus amphitrite]
MWMCVLQIGAALAAVLPGLAALELNQVIIPKHVMRGADADLACLYDLQGKELYSIKWYKDGKEFYRFEPSTSQKKKNFPQPGIKVDLSASNATHVRLQETTLQYTGRYMCEISTEAPTFSSKQGKGEVHVVVFPEEGPVITGGKSRYEVGDRVKVNCTSYKSKPAAELTWFINNEEAALEHVELWPPTIHDDGLETMTAGLHFRVRPHHFRSGNIKLKCVSQIPDMVQPVYWQSREESAVGDRPPEVSQVLDSTADNRKNNGCPLCHEIANWLILAVSVILAR